MSGNDRLEFASVSPRAVNCLSWSDDGGIAVAANDQVHLFIPNHGRHRDDSFNPTGDPWHRVKLQVDSFNEREWPVSPMKPSADFLIGNEVATVEVVALAWSPAGLGQYGRCCLAVLTSNRILSIWSPGPDPKTLAGWRREMVVNHCFSSGWTDAMALAWLPPLDPSDDLQYHPSRALKRRVHCITVVTMDRTLSVLKFGRTKKNRLIAVEVCSTALDLQSRGKEQNKDSALKAAFNGVNDLKWAVRIADWSSWEKSSGDSQDSTVTKSEVLRLQLSHLPDGEFTVEEITSSGFDLHKALKSIRPATWDGPGTYHETRASNVRGDQKLLIVSGQYLSLRFLLQDPAVGGEQRITEIEPSLEYSEIRKRIQSLADEFSKEHGLGGRVQVMVWGISSWDDYMAVCVTLHPTHTLQYMVNSNSQVHVLFSHLSLEPGQASHADGTHDPMADFPSPRAPYSKNDREAHEGGILWPGLHSPTVSRRSTACNGQLVFANIVAAFLRIAPGTDPALHASLVSSSFASTPGQETPFDGLVSALAAAAAQVPASATTADPGLTSSDYCSAIVAAANAHIERRHATELLLSGPRFVERCAVGECGAPVLWRGLHEAACAAGHTHLRCALTALALANPYVVKRCEACARAYLDENALLLYYADAKRTGALDERKDRGDGGDGETTGAGGENAGGWNGERENEEGESGGKAGPVEDGVRWMLDHAAICVYCGGKFVREMPLPAR